MLPIQEMFAPVNQWTRPANKINKVRGIVLHWTASFNAPARNIATYFSKTAIALAKKALAEGRSDDPYYASAQLSVDDNEIWAVMPYMPSNVEMAYAVGSKTYLPDALNRLGSYPNNSTISIEMCIDANGKLTEKTFQNAVELTAFLLKTYGLTINDIWTHRMIVGWKDCPRPWMRYDANGNVCGENAEFDRFKQEVAKKMNPQPVATPVKTLLDGQPINGWTDGYIINDRTHLIWTVLNTLKITYEFKGDGLFVINGREVQGHVINGNTFLQWNLLGVEMTPNQIEGGYDFVTVKPAPALFRVFAGGVQKGAFSVRDSAFKAGWDLYNGGAKDSYLTTPEGDKFTFDLHQSENPDKCCDCCDGNCTCKK